jgi:putative transposase
MDEEHLMAAACYVALNPERARLVKQAKLWPHSSVAAHLAGGDDGLVSVRPLLDRAPRFADLIETDADDPAFVALRLSELMAARSAGRSSRTPSAVNSVASSRPAGVDRSRRRGIIKYLRACHRNRA